MGLIKVVLSYLILRRITSCETNLKHSVLLCWFACLHKCDNRCIEKTRYSLRLQSWHIGYTHEYFKASWTASQAAQHGKKDNAQHMCDYCPLAARLCITHRYKLLVAWRHRECSTYSRSYLSPLTLRSAHLIHFPPSIDFYCRPLRLGDWSLWQQMKCVEKTGQNSLMICSRC